MELFLGLLFLLATETPTKAPAGASVSLPKPQEIEVSLSAALRARRSTRKFQADRQLTRAELSTILWAMTGINRPDASGPRAGKRTAPSAYNACAIDVLITGAEGTFRYVPEKHAVVPHESRGGEDLRSRLTGADWARTAPVLVLLVANLDRYPDRVKLDRRQHYAHADAAAIGQNLHLACAAMNLGTVITASAPREADSILGHSEMQRVVFVLPVGYPGAPEVEKE